VLGSVLAKTSSSGACHLYVHATESTVVPDARERGPSSSDARSRAPATSITCRRTRGTSRPLGRFGARQPRGVHSIKAASAKGSPSTRAQLSHAVVCRLDGWPGRRSRCSGQDYAKLTKDTILSCAHSLSLRPLRRKRVPLSDEPADSRVSAECGTSRRATRGLRARQSRARAVSRDRDEAAATRSGTFRRHSAKATARNRWQHSRGEF
jgi:hypothetical protein